MAVPIPPERSEMATYRRRNKYGNKWCEHAGQKFQSKAEMIRYRDYLKPWSEEGLISDLRRQVRFELIPAQRINGEKVEDPCHYVADFVYVDDSGKTVVEDVKGNRNTSDLAYKMFVIKRKLMLQRYGIRVKEVTIKNGKAVLV